MAKEEARWSPSHKLAPLTPTGSVGPAPAGASGSPDRDMAAHGERKHREPPQTRDLVPPEERPQPSDRFAGVVPLQPRFNSAGGGRVRPELQRMPSQDRRMCPGCCETLSSRHFRVADRDTPNASCKACTKKQIRERRRLVIEVLGVRPSGLPFSASLKRFLEHGHPPMPIPESVLQAGPLRGSGPLQWLQEHMQRLVFTYLSNADQYRAAATCWPLRHVASMFPAMGLERVRLASIAELEHVRSAAKNSGLRRDEGLELLRVLEAASAWQDSSTWR